MVWTGASPSSSSEPSVSLSAAGAGGMLAGASLSCRFAVVPRAPFSPFAFSFLADAEAACCAISVAVTLAGCCCNRDRSAATWSGVNALVNAGSSRQRKSLFGASGADASVQPQAPACAPRQARVAPQVLQVPPLPLAPHAPQASQGPRGAAAEVGSSFC
ncbi:unnamed protein product [Closterium sp. NIES-54]